MHEVREGWRPRALCGWVVALAVGALSAGYWLPDVAWAQGAPQGQQAQQQAPGTQPAKPDANQSQEEAKAAIRRLIEERLKEKERAAASQPRRPVARPIAPGQTGAQPGAQPPTTTTQAAGCAGDKSVQLDLNPLPPDRPQPKWALDQPIVDMGGVWKGKSADYVFKIRNDGEGVLNIRVSGH